MQTARGKGKIRKSDRSNTQWLTVGTPDVPGHLYNHERPSIVKTKYKQYNKGKND